MTGGRRNLVTLLQLAEANEADQTRRPSSNPARKALVAENHAGSQCSFKPLVTSSAILADEGDFGTRAGVEVRYLGRRVLVQMPADRLFVHLLVDVQIPDMKQIKNDILHADVEQGTLKAVLDEVRVSVLRLRLRKNLAAFLGVVVLHLLPLVLRSLVLSNRSEGCALIAHLAPARQLLVWEGNVRKLVHKGNAWEGVLAYLVQQSSSTEGPIPRQRGGSGGPRQGEAGSVRACAPG
mmetsp:Transcript_37596/g.82744  ORF Transcript_37596/g.82744 Transcript_37596/m.82744 type:complete len:237 (+) Transcript_37596:656-1366(+)